MAALDVLSQNLDQGMFLLDSGFVSCQLGSYMSLNVGLWYASI